MVKIQHISFLWIGNDNGTGGVGILLAEKWVENVLEIKHISDRICYTKLYVGGIILVICPLNICSSSWPG